MGVSRTRRPNKHWLPENFYTQQVKITLDHRFGVNFQVDAYRDARIWETVLVIAVPMSDGTSFPVREHHPDNFDGKPTEFLTDETLATIMLLLG